MSGEQLDMLAEPERRKYALSCPSCGRKPWETDVCPSCGFDTHNPADWDAAYARGMEWAATEGRKLLEGLGLATTETEDCWNTTAPTERREQQ